MTTEHTDAMTAPSLGEMAGAVVEHLRRLLVVECERAGDGEVAGLVRAGRFAAAADLMDAKLPDGNVGSPAKGTAARGGDI